MTWLQWLQVAATAAGYIGLCWVYFVWLDAELPDHLLGRFVGFLLLYVVLRAAVLVLFTALVAAAWAVS